MSLNNKIEEALNQQIQSEFYSSYVYLSMSGYSDSQNLPGFAAWMRAQSEEERGHAMRLFDYVQNRGGRVRLGRIAQPRLDFESPRVMFEEALRQEQSVTRTIHELYRLAQEEKDYPTEVELQWFVQEQVEEEKTILDILAQLAMIGDQPAALVMLDHRLGGRTDEA
ncbi:MAG: ferritin [Candidatus Aminicenantes bacterium]|nr:ferritin [Candidatus Aminicenantes bacterium]